MPCKGYVVDNDDPKMLGRVKCIIQGRWEDEDHSKLPWVYPINYCFGLPSNTSFRVPEKDSELIITFPFEDEYSPFYIGSFISEGTRNTLFEEDYPNTYGFNDAIQWIRINNQNLLIEYFNKLKDLVYFDDKGSLHVSLPEDLICFIGKNLFIKIGEKQVVSIGSDNSCKVGGNTQLDVADNFSISSGKTIDLKATENAGIVAAQIVSLEGSTIMKNSGITFGVADQGKSSVSSDTSSLDSKIDELKSKVDELKAEYDALMDSIDISKKLIKGEA